MEHHDWTLLEVSKAKYTTCQSARISVWITQIADEAEHIKVDLDLSTDELDRNLHAHRWNDEPLQ